MSKKEIFTTVVIVWLLATTGYVLYDQWINYQANGIQKAYEAAVNRIILEAEKKECQSFSIFSGEKKVDLVNVACLKQEGVGVSEGENKK